MLKGAIAEAEAASVPDEEVLDASVLLAEFRMFHVAGQPDADPEELRTAIDEAEEMCVDEQRLADARRMLAEFELLAATDGDDLQAEAVEAAIAAATAAGVREEVVEQANNKLALFLARRELAEACAGSSVLRVKKAIETSEGLGVSRADLACAVLRRVHLELLDATNGSSVKLLLLSIKASEEAGVEEGTLAAARKKLRLLQLEEATAELDPIHLRRCIENAKACGIIGGPIDSGKAKLKQLDVDVYREVVEEELRFAMDAATADLKVLDAAIEAAAAVEADLELLARARRALAERTLSVATAAANGADGVEIGDIIALLEKCLVLAEQEGMVEEEQHAESLAAVRTKLEELRAKQQLDAAQTELETALAGGTIEDLRSALAVAKEAGVDQTLIKKAQELLQ